MNWMEEFLNRCLADVPPGAYRERTEQELRDHLTALVQDLEGTGYTPEEACALAQTYMGDPAELSHRCLQEWRRRSGQEQNRLTGKLFLLALSVFVAGVLYSLNIHNFGKAWVRDWGVTAIVIAQCMFHSSYLFRKRLWFVTRLSCIAFAVIQLPPILCWTFTVYLGDAFELCGVMVPGWLGLLVHVLFFRCALEASKEIRRIHTAGRGRQTA